MIAAAGWSGRVDSTVVAWGLLLLALAITALVGAEGRGRQLEALRRRDGESQ